MDIFKFFRRKPKHLSVVEYDKLVDSKVAKIREFVRQNLNVERDDKDFEDAFARTFEQYEHNLRLELMKTPNKWGVLFGREEIALSPISALHAFNQTYRRKKKVAWYKRFFKFLKSIRVYVVLFVKDRFLRRELRKIKKLFPDYKMSNDRAMNVLMATKLNKRMLARKK